jgi:stage V sporulation protein SpoVS
MEVARFVGLIPRRVGIHFGGVVVGLLVHDRVETQAVPITTILEGLEALAIRPKVVPIGVDLLLQLIDLGVQGLPD